MAANWITYGILYSWHGVAHDDSVPGRTHFYTNARADCNARTDDSLPRASGLVSLHCAFRRFHRVNCQGHHHECL